MQVCELGLWQPVWWQGGGDRAQRQPSPVPHRFQGRTGLLPAATLQRDGLGTLLSGPWLHHGSPRSPQAAMLPPPVPTRPPLSTIQSRCCTITRKALQRDPGRQGAL